MQRTFTVGDYRDTQWVRVCEDGYYHRRLHYLFDHFADGYGRSEAIPDALLLDELIIDQKLDVLYSIYK